MKTKLPFKNEIKNYFQTMLMTKKKKKILASLTQEYDVTL